jgi:AraC-like DNA-binding protein
MQTLHARAGTSRRHHLAHLLEALAPADGAAPATVDGIHLVRSVAALAQVPWRGPCVIIFGHGGHAGSYAVLPTAAPWDVPGWLGPGEPGPALVVAIDLQSAAELLLAIGRRRARVTAVPGIVTLLRGAMADAVLRLLRALRSAEEARILGPGIVRELLYRVLTGPQGGIVAMTLRHHGHLGRIGRVLRRLHAGMGGQINVAALAREAGMSATSFHHHFKAVTGTTPLQYLKTARLHRARLLMAQEGISASAASHRVGYESSSQFSREFKRQFGRPPGSEAARMRRALFGGRDYHVDGNTGAC